MTLKELLGTKNLSLRKAAKIAGIHPNTLYHWGKHQPRIDILQALASTHDIPLQALIDTIPRNGVRHENP